MVNVVLLSVGLIVAMCVDFQWFRFSSRGERRGHARHARVGL